MHARFRLCSWRLLLGVQDNPMEAIGAKEHVAKQVSWMDSILSLIPGRKQAASSEPSDEAIKRTHDYLRCRVLHRCACGHRQRILAAAAACSGSGCGPTPWAHEPKTLASAHGGSGLQSTGQQRCKRV
jgi:hypothetical protein